MEQEPAGGVGVRSCCPLDSTHDAEGAVDGALRHVAPSAATVSAPIFWGKWPLHALLRLAHPAVAVRDGTEGRAMKRRR